jgi:hypothetical protein
MAFIAERQPGLMLWLGQPDCQTAHDYLLSRLINMGVNFIPCNRSLDVRRKGNLGEFICLSVSSYTSLENTLKFANNAVNPLGAMSLPGLDLTYIFVDSQNSDRDLAIVQEVKTTGSDDLSYADNLTRDYQKLFEDDLEFTLASRLQVIANKLELEQNRPELCERVLAMAGEIPSECRQIRLIPTLVHERVGAAPIPKLLAIRTAISSYGWPLTHIHGWSIALSDLDDRLQRLARGQH